MIIGAAWLKEKNGEKYFYVRCDLPLLGSLSFIVKKRHNKKGSQPDYDVIWYPEKKATTVSSVPEELPEDVPLTQDNEVKTKKQNDKAGTFEYWYEQENSTLSKRPF